MPEDWASIAKRANANAPQEIAPLSLSPAECQAIWRTMAYVQFNNIKRTLDPQIQENNLPNVVKIPKEFDLRHVKDDFSDSEDGLPHFRPANQEKEKSDADTHVSFSSKVAVAGSVADNQSVQSHSVNSSSEATKVTVKNSEHSESDSILNSLKKKVSRRIAESMENATKKCSGDSIQE